MTLRCGAKEEAHMSLFSAFRYDGKHALVVGGASGMGAAVAELVQDAGAEVVVMDFAEVKLADRSPRRFGRLPPSGFYAIESRRRRPRAAGASRQRTCCRGGTR